MRNVKKKDVVLSIQGCRFSPEPSENHMMEFMTGGSMTTHNNGTTISYRGSFDGADSQTTLLVEDGRVTMLRGGPKSTQLVFEQGRRHVSYYDTPEGAVTVDVTASHVEAEFSESGGHIEVAYGVEIGGRLTEESHMSIDVHTASGTWAAIPEGLSVYRDEFIN